MRGEGSGTIVFLALAACALTLAVSLALLVVPALWPSRHATFTLGAQLASVGVLGLLSGACVILSNFRDYRGVLAASGLVFSLAYMVPLAYLYLAIAHLYGIPAVTLLCLSLWNINRKVRMAKDASPRP